MSVSQERTKLVVTGAAAAGARVAAVARLTLLDALRQKSFAAVLVLALVLLGSARWVAALGVGQAEIKFLADFGSGALVLFGSILAVVIPAQLWFRDMESRSVQTYLARPLRRGEWVWGQWLGAAWVLVGYTAVLAGLLSALLAWREAASVSASGIDQGALAAWSVLQALRFALIAALTLFVASFSTSFIFTATAGLLLVAIGQLRFLAQEAWTATGSGCVEGALQVVGWLIPNLQVFSLGEGWQAGAAPGVGPWLAAVGYGSAYIAVFVSLAGWIFSRRDL